MSDNPKVTPQALANTLWRVAQSERPRLQASNPPRADFTGAFLLGPWPVANGTPQVRRPRSWPTTTNALSASNLSDAAIDIAIRRRPQPGSWSRTGRRSPGRLPIARAEKEAAQRALEVEQRELREICR